MKTLIDTSKLTPDILGRIKTKIKFEFEGGYFFLEDIINSLDFKTFIEIMKQLNIKSKKYDIKKNTQLLWVMNNQLSYKFFNSLSSKAKIELAFNNIIRLEDLNIKERINYIYEYRIRTGFDKRILMLVPPRKLCKYIKQYPYDTRHMYNIPNEIRYIALQTDDRLFSVLRTGDPKLDEYFIKRNYYNARYVDNLSRELQLYLLQFKDEFVLQSIKNPIDEIKIKLNKIDYFEKFR